MAFNIRNTSAASSSEFTTTSSSISLGPYFKVDTKRENKVTSRNRQTARSGKSQQLNSMQNKLEKLSIVSPYQQQFTTINPIKKRPLQIWKSRQGSKSTSKRAIKSAGASGATSLTPTNCTQCKVYLRFLGCRPLSSVEGHAGRSHQVSIFQQPSGGSSLNVYRGNLQKGDTFMFTSRRQYGFPFSIVAYVNSILYLRVSACCEYRYRQGCVLGGQKGHFMLISVTGSSPCFRCYASKELFLKSLINSSEQNVTEDFRAENDDQGNDASPGGDYEDDFDYSEMSEDDDESVENSDVVGTNSESQNHGYYLKDEYNGDATFENNELTVGQELDDQEITLLENKPPLITSRNDSPKVSVDSPADETTDERPDPSNDEIKDGDSISGLREILDNYSSNIAPLSTNEYDINIPNNSDKVDEAVCIAFVKQWTNYRDEPKNYDSSDEDNDLVYVAPKFLTVTVDVHASQSPKKEVLT